MDESRKPQFLEWLKEDYPEADITIKDGEFLNSMTRGQFRAWCGAEDYRDFFASDYPNGVDL